MWRAESFERVLCWIESVFLRCTASIVVVVDDFQREQLRNWLDHICDKFEHDILGPVVVIGRQYDYSVVELDCYFVVKYCAVVGYCTVVEYYFVAEYYFVVRDYFVIEYFEYHFFDW